VTQECPYELESVTSCSHCLQILLLCLKWSTMHWVGRQTLLNHLSLLAWTVYLMRPYATHFCPLLSSLSHILLASNI